jgi:Cytidylate kinase-like family
MTLTHTPKYIEELVDKQCKRWELRPEPSHENKQRPVIIIVQQAGSIGSEVAERLSEELKMDLHGDSILQEIARQAHLSERMVRTLDEKGRSYIEEIVANLTWEKTLPLWDYFKHLVRVIVTIGRHGNAIILGHGAPYILRDPDYLRVRFVAPLELRVRRMSKESNLSFEEARKRMKEVDADRRAYVRQYFHVDDDDNRYFDLVINSEFIDLHNAAEILKTALTGKESSSIHDGRGRREHIKDAKDAA